MAILRKRLGVWVLGMGLLMAVPAVAADLIDDVDRAYAARELRRTPFDLRTAQHEDSAELRFLENLFVLTDEASLLGTNVVRWLETDGARGLHPADYHERIEDLRVRLTDLKTPDRVRSVRDLLLESLVLQDAFVNDGYRAIEAGRPFESQLTNEYAYHEGLHRSHRLILKAYAELRALFPEIGEASHRAFLDHLRGMDLI